jgi:hypothetical protein
LGQHSLLYIQAYLWGVLVVIDELLHWGSTRCYMARPVADAAGWKKHGKEDKDFDNMTVATTAPGDNSKSVVGFSSKDSTSDGGFSSKDLGGFGWRKEWGPNPMGCVGDDSSSVPSSGGSQPDVQHKDGMESHTSSKKSKARSSKDRGPKRRAKARARLEARLAEQGKAYDPLRGEQNASASMQVKGTIATAIQAKMIENTPEETEDEKTAKMQHQLLAENSLLAKEPQNPGRWVSIKDGQPWCELCKKFGQMHVGSKQHILRVEEDAILTFLSGKAGTTRRFHGGNGFPGPATKKGILNHYGSGLMSLPAEAAILHAQKSMSEYIRP